MSRRDTASVTSARFMRFRRLINLEVLTFWCWTRHHQWLCHESTSFRGVNPCGGNISVSCGFKLRMLPCGGTSSPRSYIEHVSCTNFYLAHCLRADTDLRVSQSWEGNNIMHVNGTFKWFRFRKGYNFVDDDGVLKCYVSAAPFVSQSRICCAGDNGL